MKKPSDFTPMEQALFKGIHGTPVIKKEERIKHLGELKENVAVALTYEQMAQKELAQSFVEAIADQDIKTVVLSGKIALRDWARKYSDYAKKLTIPVRIVSDKEHVGKIGLVVTKK